MAYPGQPQPGYPQPGYPQPGYPQPGQGRNEQDPLLELPGAVNGRTPREVKGKPGFDHSPGSARRVILVALEATIIEWISFVAWSITFLLGYHVAPKTLVDIALGFILVCSVLAIALWFMGETATRVANRKRATIFGAVAFFTFVGSIVGTSIYLKDCHDYWSFHTKRHYTNVSPDEPAAGHLDASAIIFMEGARPDTSRAMSYRRYKTTYCVAPMALDESYSADVEAAVSSNVQYWAAGKNCCGTGQGYTCGDVDKPEARAGLVISDMTGEDAVGKGLLSDDDIGYYNQAVLMAMAKYDMTSPDERIYVHFVHGLEEAVHAELQAALKSWTFAILAVIPLCLATGIMVVLVAADDYQKDLVNVKHTAFSTVARYT